ncbi:hypothetical protein FOL47_006528 [Perkinsus chesapeaki]|uniref:Uncharacterized protein n=1 Tax=Perkinsus chesapeaki TaxID=330153 RepID=A0A7J6LRC5_PERCH|nr:hypothetical protein FOL47_006528 [Perkinsus chesapeaki]
MPRIVTPPNRAAAPYNNTHRTVYRYCVTEGQDPPHLEEVSELSGHKFGVSDIAVNSVGTVIVTSGLDSTVRVWKRSRQGKYEHYRNIPAIGGKTIDIGDIDHIGVLTREAGRYNVMVSIGSAGGKVHFTDLATDASSAVESTAVRGTKRPAKRLIPPVDCLYRGANKAYLGCVTAMELSDDGSYLTYGTSSGYVGVACLRCGVEDNALKLECSLQGVMRCFKTAISSPVRCLTIVGDTLLVGGEANVGKIIALDMTRLSGYLVDDTADKTSDTKPKRLAMNPAVVGSIPLNYSCRVLAILVSESPSTDNTTRLITLVSSDGVMRVQALPNNAEQWSSQRSRETLAQFDLKPKGTLKLSHVAISGAAAASLKADAKWRDCVAVGLAANGSIEIYDLRECAPPTMPELPIEVEGGVFDMFKSAASQHRQLTQTEDWQQQQQHVEELGHYVQPETDGDVEMKNAEAAVGPPPPPEHHPAQGS